MGNCIRPESKAMWGGEDWTPVFSTDNENQAMRTEEEQLVSSKNAGYSSVSKIKEIKVKVTKKQLEEWLGKMDVQQQGMCVERALAKLVKVSVHCKIHDRSWRPMLQTIHEV